MLLSSPSCFNRDDHSDKVCPDESSFPMRADPKLTPEFVSKDRTPLNFFMTGVEFDSPKCKSAPFSFYSSKHSPRRIASPPPFNLRPRVYSMNLPINCFDLFRLTLPDGLRPPSSSSFLYPHIPHAILFKPFFAQDKSGYLAPPFFSFGKRFF